MIYKIILKIKTRPEHGGNHKALRVALAEWCRLQGIEVERLEIQTAGKVYDCAD